MSTRQLALEYLRRGWAVIPIPRNAKAPNLPNWQSLRVTPATVDQFFTHTDGNIGVLLGEPSGGLADVDLDCPEAVALAEQFLPPTAARFGRTSNPNSHWLYQAARANTLKFDAGSNQGGTLLELRSTGCQTVFPGSRYAGDKGPRGEPIRWDENGAPAVVDSVALAKDCGQLAAAVVLLRHWRPGHRSDLAAALTGVLISAGWQSETIDNFVRAVATAAGDTDLGDRAKAAYHAKRLERPEAHVFGFPKLAEIMGDDAAGRMLGWLQIELRSRQRRETPDAHALGEIVLERSAYARDKGDELYVFREGAYRPDGARWVRELVRAVVCDEWRVGSKWRSQLAEETIRYVRLRVPELWERPPLDTVNVQNGLLDVHTRELRPHSPEFLSSVQISAAYDPDAAGEFWPKYARDWFPDNATKLAWEIPAYLMLPDNSWQIAFYLFNELGENGKTRYLEGVKSFLGPSNVSAISLQALEDDRFATSGLVGKLANIHSDLPATVLRGSSVFKAITGGDELRAERKYDHAFKFRPFVRLIFSGNSLPRSLDSSNAFFRRWIVIPFARRFDDPKVRVPETTLDAQLALPAERSWLLGRALEALPRLRSSGFNLPPEISETTNEFRAVTDPVLAWLREHTIVSGTASVPIGELKGRYNRDAQRERLPALTDQALGLRVRQHAPSVKVRVRTVAGRRQKCYEGIGLRELEAEL